MALARPTKRLHLPAASAGVTTSSTSTAAALLLVAQVLVRSGQSQMYSSGIGKSTHLVSDATRTLDWFLAHLPASHDVAGLDCKSEAGEYNESYCPCGQAGRVELWCIDCQACPDCQPWGKQAGYGLHTISYNNSLPNIERHTPRAIGDVGIAAIEGHVTRKMAAAVAAGGYDAFLDFNTGLWVADLDPFVREFAGNSPALAVQWADTANGKTYYSLLVQVAGSLVILEFMSAKQTLLPKILYQAPSPRFVFPKGVAPEGLFPPLNSTGPRGNPIPRPARISHYSSNLTRDAIYYSEVLGRDVSRIFPSADGKTRTLVVDFRDMSGHPNYMQLHLVERSPDDTHGAFAVADLEAAMNEVHRTSHTSDICSWDQFNDFHFGVATHNWQPLSKVIPRIERLGYKYDTGISTWHGANGKLLTLFAMAPNGITIQLHNMARGTYVPTAPSVEGHDGLCGLGPPECSKGHGSKEALRHPPSWRAQP